MWLTSLSSRDDISTFEDCGNGVCLNRSWYGVPTLFHVAQHDWVESSLLKRANGCWSFGCLRGDLNRSKADEVSTDERIIERRHSLVEKLTSFGSSITSEQLFLQLWNFRPDVTIFFLPLVFHGLVHPTSDFFGIDLFN